MAVHGTHPACWYPPTSPPRWSRSSPSPSRTPPPRLGSRPSSAPRSPLPSPHPPARAGRPRYGWWCTGPETGPRGQSRLPGAPAGRTRPGRGCQAEDRCSWRKPHRSLGSSRPQWKGKGFAGCRSRSRRPRFRSGGRTPPERPPWRSVPEGQTPTGSLRPLRWRCRGLRPGSPYRPRGSRRRKRQGSRGPDCRLPVSETVVKVPPTNPRGLGQPLHQ